MMTTTMAVVMVLRGKKEHRVGREDVHIILLTMRQYNLSQYHYHHPCRNHANFLKVFWEGHGTEMWNSRCLSEVQCSCPLAAMTEMGHIKPVQNVVFFAHCLFCIFLLPHLTS